MNIAKLFETQQILRNRIGYEGSDRFEKLILALLVEVGECANEWRGFKYWSKNQEARTREVDEYDYEETIIQPNEFGFGGILSSSKPKTYKNPLLEEYVDGLHFLLEIGLELNYTNMLQATIEDIAVESQFNDVFNDICYLRNICDLRLANQSDWEEDEKQEAFEYLWADFFGLGKMLGFTWKQIEQAYYDKNQVNHERQDSGY